VNEPRISYYQALEFKPCPLQRLGSHVGDKHVSAVYQATQCRHAIGVLQVEADRALVAVEIEKLAGHSGVASTLGERAQEIAAWRLDLDHVRTLVGEGARADRADHHGSLVDDADAREWTTAHLAYSNSTAAH
jgi:hypothetical protein